MKRRTFILTGTAPAYLKSQPQMKGNVEWYFRFLVKTKEQTVSLFFWSKPKQTGIKKPIFGFLENEKQLVFVSACVFFFYSGNGLITRTLVGKNIQSVTIEN